MLSRSVRNRRPSGHLASGTDGGVPAVQDGEGFSCASLLSDYYNVCADCSPTGSNFPLPPPLRLLRKRFPVTCHWPQRWPSNSQCLSSGERPRPPSTARVQRGPSEGARCASTEDHQPPSPPLLREQGISTGVIPPFLSSLPSAARPIVSYRQTRSASIHSSSARPTPLPANLMKAADPALRSWLAQLQLAVLPP